jgi:hypothetical protein
VLISAVFPDGYAAGEGDEAVQLWNVGPEPVDLTGWSVTDGEGTATFPAAATLAPGNRIWLAREAGSFARSFGHPPDWTWASAAATSRHLATVGGGPALANGGDAVLLRAADGRLVDTAAYGTAPPAAGWSGPAVRPYHGGALAAAHQVLYRKLDPAGGRPVPDRDLAADWASDPADVLQGRRVRFPGWELEERARPENARAAARVELAVAPDALYGFLRRHLGAASTAVDLLVYTFENPDLAEALAERARAGVRVRVLVDGDPAGGVDPNQRWCLAQIVAAGGTVYWMDQGGTVGPRYRSAHAKLIVVDHRLALLGSENPSLGSTPSDDLGDGTAGRRGVMLATDAPAVVAWAEALIAGDLDPGAHVDLRPFQPRDPRRGAPAEDFLPLRGGGGSGYVPIATTPLVLTADVGFVLQSAPENALDASDGLLGLLNRGGNGDNVQVQQLDEPVWWGDGPNEGPVALNPRVQAYLAAARRGARVRVLLDGFFDDPAQVSSNAATVHYLNTLARQEALDLQARLGNPTGLGLHNKMVLLRLGGTYWSHIGSLNGTEVASKANREVAANIESVAVHDYLAAVFAWDWAASGALALWLPRVDVGLR